MPKAVKAKSALPGALAPNPEGGDPFDANGSPAESLTDEQLRQRIDSLEERQAELDAKDAGDYRTVKRQAALNTWMKKELIEGLLGD